MAILTIEHHRKRQAGMLNGRVLIGRWPQNTIFVDDRALSRIHAWIGQSGGKYYIADAGSRSGTFVNGQPLRDRHFLLNGDKIQVGPLLLSFLAGDVFPLGCKQIDLSPRSSVELSDERGLFMDCACGAPLWVPRHFESAGRCRYCGHRVGKRVIQSLLETGRPSSPSSTSLAAPALADTALDAEFAALLDDTFDSPPLFSASSAVIPPSASSEASAEVSVKPNGSLAAQASPTRAEHLIPALPTIPSGAQIDETEIPQSVTRSAPATRTVQKAQVCGVCHAPIANGDDTTICPSCGLDFHSDCWCENRGCSAYGCSQVGCLETKVQASVESNL